MGENRSNVMWYKENLNLKSFHIVLISLRPLKKNKKIV